MNFFEMSMYLESMKLALFKSEAFKNGIAIDSSPLPSRYVVHHDEYSGQSPCDFLGRIVSVDIEGNITVRQVGRNSCRDICVPLERILMVIDDDYDVPPLPLPPLDMFGLPSFSPWMSNSFMFDRTYEYEGGERLDDDSNDEEWLTEDEFEADNDSDDEGGFDDGSRHVIGVDESAAPKVAEINITAEMVEEQEEKLEASKADDQSNASIARSSPSPSTCPPGFSVLESDPPSDHHFISASSRGKSGLRMSRIRKEYEILETSLPPGIFVRSWESRIDLLRVLIIGPQGTPYEYAPFVIDFQFPGDYPNKPPASFFHSWTNGQGRVNPNLYEDGRICLSLLGTWPTKNPEESWSSIKSTALQILVSIMGLVLVKNPFYSKYILRFLEVQSHSNISQTRLAMTSLLWTTTVASSPHNTQKRHS
jgi:ubiquitin-conjugating enzyme E2 O